MGSAGFASGLALAELAVDVDAGVVEIAVLGDAGHVEHAVDPTVAAEVEAMLDREPVAFAGGRARSAPVPHQRANLDSRANRNGSPTSAIKRRCCDRADAGFVTQCGAVFVEQRVDVAFELADLATRRPVLVDERDQPRQPILAGHGRHDRGVDLFEATEPAFDLAGRGELVADLDGELGDLVVDVVKHQRADGRRACDGARAPLRSWRRAGHTPQASGPVRGSVRPAAHVPRRLHRRRRSCPTGATDAAPLIVAAGTSRQSNPAADERDRGVRTPAG